MPWVSESAAFKAAVQNWIGNANANFPLPYGDWGKARNKRRACNKVPNGFGGFNYLCEVRATPCYDTVR